MAEHGKREQADWLRVRAAASAQLRDFGVLDAPVPASAMARRAGLELRYADFPEDENVSGFIDAESKAIYVNAAEPPSRQLFTIAHELGHWLLHKDQVMEGRQYRVLTREPLDAPKPAMEREADGFAADLLVPKFMLDKYYRDARVRPTRASLARIFGVSEEMIKYRLRNLYGV
jgi:Zn-dependent peptidase ImmA (M78 family)